MIRPVVHDRALIRVGQLHPEVIVTKSTFTYLAPPKILEGERK